MEWGKDLWNAVTTSFDGILGRLTGKDNKNNTELNNTNFSNENLSYEYTKAMSTRGILGLPPRFSSLADMRLFNFDNKKYIDPMHYLTVHDTPQGGAVFYSDPYEGQKWVDVYMKYGSLVFFEIGRPIFFKGMGKEVVQAILNGATADETVQEQGTREAMKAGISNMITFAPAGVDYAYQVKALTDVIATFLNLNMNAVDSILNDKDHPRGGGAPIYDKTATAPNSPLGLYQFNAYFGLPSSYGDISETTGELDRKNVKGLLDNGKYEAPENGKFKLIKGGSGRFDLNAYTNDIYAEVISSTICLYSDGGVESPMNMNHETGQSTLLSTITQNQAMDAVNEVMFLDSDFNPATDMANDKGIEEKAGKLGGWIKKVLGIIPVGAKLIAPQVWKGFDVSKTVEVKCVFQSVNPHPVSIFRHVLVPYMHCFAMFAPRNITSVSTTMANRLGAYAPPFVVRMYCKGAININLGMVTSITVNKVPKDLTLDGLPTRIELTMTVTDLYGVMGLPYEPKHRMSVIECAGLTEYLSSLTGVTMSQEKILLKFADVVDVKTYFMKTPKRWANRIQQSILSGYNSHVQGLVGVVYGKINKL